MLDLPYVNNPILCEKSRRNLHAFPPLQIMQASAQSLWDCSNSNSYIEAASKARIDLFKSGSTHSICCAQLQKYRKTKGHFLESQLTSV